MQGTFDLGHFILVIAQQVASELRAEFTKNPLPAAPRLLTVEQAATYMGRTEEAMQHMVANGKVPTVRLDRRVFIDVRDLDRLIENNKTQPR